MQAQRAGPAPAQANEGYTVAVSAIESCSGSLLLAGTGFCTLAATGSRKLGREFKPHSPAFQGGVKAAEMSSAEATAPIGRRRD